MKYLVIDRFEGIYAICENEERSLFAIERSELPEGAEVGSVMEITSTGELTLDEVETQNRRNRTATKQDKAFN